MCHNCGVSTTFYNFLSQVDGTLIKEYALERYKNGETGNNNYPKPTFEEAKSKPVFREKIALDSIDKLPDGHFAKTYVQSRKIPDKFYSQLYFAPDFKKFIEELGVEKDGLIDDDQRLIIPFYDRDKNLIALQGRALGQSKMRYITVKIVDEVHKLYGQERVDEEKMIYVVEGPIDSMFLDNAVATADSHLEAASNVFDKSKITLVFDNEPRNKDICKQIDRRSEEHTSELQSH